MKKNLLFFMLLLFSMAAFSQKYVPIDTADYQKREAFLRKSKISSEQYLEVLKTKFSGSFRRNLVNNYKAFYEEFVGQVRDKDFTFFPETQSYLDDIVKKIQKNNPTISGELTVLIAKNNTPNAMCLNDGTFIINMGLFNWLDNEDQLASVLGHEIAHKLKNHSIKWQEKLLEIEEGNSNQVKQLKKQRGNIKDQAFDLLKNTLYQGSVERRKNEEEADSLGYVLFRNTDYKKQDFINALKNLEKFDTIAPTVVQKEIYRQLFDLPKAPFKEKWLKMEDFSQYQYDLYKEKLDKDSMSTHPEIVNRIALLENNFPELKTNSVSEKGKPSEAFLRIKKMARMEIIPNYFQSQDYGRGIYAALQFLQDKENEDYYKDWLGQLFQKIKEARQDYKLNRYLDRVNPKTQSESYQQFLNFMWNLSLDDIDAIAKHYQKNSL